MKAQDYLRCITNVLGKQVAIAATMRKYNLSIKQVLELTDYGGGGMD